MSKAIYTNERLGLYVSALTGPASMGEDRRMYQLTVSNKLGVVHLTQREFEHFLEMLAPESDDA